MTHNRPVHAVLVLVLSLAFTFSAGSQIFNSRTPVLFLSLGALCLLFIGVCISDFLVQKVIWPNLINYSRRVQIIWVLACFLAACWLIYTIPLTIYPKNNVLTVNATGMSNSLAQGSEVWLRKFTDGTKATSVNLSFACKGGKDKWQFQQGALTSINNQPSRLVCSIKSDSEIWVTFGTHPWSGKVRVSFDNQVFEEDLYSREGGVKAISLPVNLTRNEKAIRVLLIFLNAFWIGILLFSTSLWFVNRPIKSWRANPRTEIAWYWFALLLMIGWFIYLLAFWPGFMSPDSFYQWGQTVSGKYNDWHPAIHTLTIWLVTQIWYSPAAVAIFDILILSVIAGWGLSLIHRWGTPLWLFGIVIIFIVMSPGIGLMTITLWKDIPYSIFGLALTLLILVIVRSNGNILEQKRVWVMLGIVGALVALYRHNGTLVAFGTLFVLIISYWNKRKQLAEAILITLVLWILVRGPVYRWIGVDMNPKRHGQSLAVEYRSLSLILWLKKEGAPISSYELDLINRITLEGKGLDTDLLVDYSNEVRKLALELLIRRPIPSIRYFLSGSTFIFQIIQPSNVRTEYAGLTIFPNRYGFVIDSKFDIMHQMITYFSNFSKLPEWDWLFWRNAFWMYVLVFTAIIGSLRTSNWKYLLLVCPVLLNTLPLIFLSGGHLSRYIFLTLLTGPLLSGYLLFIQPKRE